jgi:5'-nucleotidase
VLEVMPFANTLALVDLTGVELQQALEDGIDYLLTRYGPHDPPYLPYIAGIRCNVLLSAAKGARVSGLQIKDDGGAYQPVQPAAVYRTVTNAFVAGGGDGFSAIKNASGFRNDTGMIDSDAFLDHLQRLGTVANPTEQRMTLLQ